MSGLLEAILARLRLSEASLAELQNERHLDLPKQAGLNAGFFLYGRMDLCAGGLGGSHRQIRAGSGRAVE